MHIIKNIFVLLLATTVLNSCAIVKLFNKSIQVKHHGVIYGQLLNNSSQQANTVVIVYTAHEEENRITAFQILPASSNLFAFSLPENKYNIAAFNDLNGNLIRDAGEPFGRYGGPDEILLPSKEWRNADVSISSKKMLPLKLPTDLTMVDHKEVNSESIHLVLGELADLNNQTFSEKSWKKGFLSPMEFVNDNGVGIYFLEKYNQNKIPVLFINGVSGSPQKWQNFFEKINRQRYQPWFFYYPAGMHLSYSAEILNALVKELHAHYGFNRLYITAHGTGGLVARAFIIRNIYTDHQHYLKMFVSISTPWRGYPGADHEFIESLYEKALRPKLKHCVFLNLKGNRESFRSKTYMPISPMSQLGWRVQEDASYCIVTFKEDHGGILSSDEVVKVFNEQLANAEE